VIWIVVLLGAVLGGALADEPFGAVGGALIAWLWMQQRRQGARIAALEQALKGEAAPAAVPAETPVSVAAAPTVVEPEAIAEPTPALAAAAEAELTAPLPTPPSGPSLFDRARAWLFGGNTIAKAGIGILFVGLAFLAKYASEQIELPVELRLAGIGAVAIVLLVLGWRLRHGRPGYAQALQGGAVAVLYLTLFVGFKFYGVLSVGPVFALMVVVAALSAALAVLQNAQALAVIGVLGGFATPLLVSTGSGNQVALFAYYLVLDLGIAAVAWFRTWRVLNVIGFAFTFCVATAWGVWSYNPEHYASSQGFLIAFFMLFNAVLLMPARRLLAGSGDAPGHERWVNGSLLFGLPVVSFALQHGLVRHLPYGTAVSALVLAAFYVLMATRLKRHPQLAVTFDASIAIAVVFLTLVIPFALDARSTAGAWALEGAGLVWLGLRQGRRLPRAFGYALLLLASGALVLATVFHGAPTAIFNALFMNALLVAAGALAAAYVVQRPAAQAVLPLPGERIAEPLLIGLGLVWLLVAVAFQVDQFVVAPYELSGWLVGLSAVALLLTALSRRLAWPRLALPLMGFAPLLAWAVAASSGMLASPASGGGWWAWPLALATQAVVLWFAAPGWHALAQRLVHTLGALVLAALGALQGRAITAEWGDAASAWPWLGWFALPALLLFLLPRPALAARWPVSAAPTAYQGLAGAVLAAGLLLWALLANLLSNGSAQPLPHVPLLNPLDLGIAAALLAAVRWFRSEAAQGVREAVGPQVPLALLGGCGFVWLNAMLVRGFHHFGGVPYRFDAWTRSLPVQTGITLLWTATALVLMWLSAKRALRLPWMLGAALLAAVVLKLLLVDLSASGTVTRIVSFIGVGVLMLVIAYVAPLPSGSKAEEVQP
jgi:uncharacterized membrane protein